MLFDAFNNKLCDDLQIVRPSDLYNDEKMIIWGCFGGVCQMEKKWQIPLLIIIYAINI